MTTFRDNDDSEFQTYINGLTHSSISSKLGVIETLETQLQTEQTAIEAQRVGANAFETVEVALKSWRQ